jgi:hypothetical protein
MMLLLRLRLVRWLLALHNVHGDFQEVGAFVIFDAAACAGFFRRSCFKRSSGLRHQGCVG